MPTLHEQPLTEERVAENEARFRLANEQIHETARDYEVDDGPIPFLCECADPGCTAIVRVGPETYEAVRREPTHFLHLPDHPSTHGESVRVVEQGEGYIVVAKLGAGAKTAAQQDPRSEREARNG